MKKLRMIVTSVIVLAIIVSAFAFNAKKGGVFCVSADANNSCDTYIANVKIEVGTPSLNYYPCWDGDKAKCVGTNNCTTAVRLVPN